MLLSDTEYHKVKSFRGYMAVSWDVFYQISPFKMRDHDKMIVLTRDRPVTPDKPQWIKQLPEENGESVECWEWSGYIIVPDRPKPSGEA